METIGSRLRKRRRTSPMPNEDSEDSPPSPKRAQSTRKVSTRAKRGQNATLQQSVPASSYTEPQPAVHAATLEPNPSPPAVSLPVFAPGIPQSSSELPTTHQHSPTGQRSPQAANQADFDTVIADIMDHGETVESHCASQGYAAMGAVDTESYSQLGASLHLKLQSLPILDNLVSSNGLLRRCSS